ncbi:ABC transporter permease [Aerococcaceae bacterium zg-BR22]|uniref:ABC transporter permease n=1 Tax=Aerococcaceae bacterium zg-1292 TaxID=2774330 RepID=UPI004064A0DE|nr:ABC transporter permease [Aerococcaceae bacterium zg-BR22]
MKKFQRELSLGLAILILVVVFTIIEPIYISPGNLIDILDQTVINGLLALGISFAILTGGIDLSVGSTFALTIVVVGSLMAAGMNIYIAIIMGLALGFVLGIINGTLVAKMQLQPFIATLTTMSIYRGVAYIITGGWPVLDIPSEFRNLFITRLILEIPTSVIYLLIVALLTQQILKRTKLGIYLYGVGGNEEATYLSGVNVDKTKIIAYGICGLCAAISGMVLLARLGSGEPATGQGYELDAIAAAAVGGISMAGGKGDMLGTLLGAILLSCLKVGLVVVGVDSFWQYIATGSIIGIAAYFEVIQNKFTGINLRKA